MHTFSRIKPIIFSEKYLSKILKCYFVTSRLVSLHMKEMDKQACTFPDI